MAVTDSDLEEAVLSYMQRTMRRNETPTRSDAIRQITGDLVVLPSGVAKVIGRMIADGRLKHVNNDQLKIGTPAP